jgi:type IV secretory pathway VirB2 component (pilin)
MSSVDFWKTYEKQKRWRMVMYTSEALVAALLLVWGVQIVQRQTWQTDPISNAFTELTPFLPYKVHGLLLVLVCAAHFGLMILNVPGWRRHCIFLEMGFLFFVEYVLILAYFSTHLFIPGLYGCPVMILFSLFNFQSLFKPALSIEEETSKCQAE